MCGNCEGNRVLQYNLHAQWYIRLFEMDTADSAILA